MKLDLGSGPTPREGFLGVDRIDAPGLCSYDFGSGRPWPFESNSVEELSSSHFIEHLPAQDLYTDRGHRDALVFFMEEAFRVAKKGAHFTIRWPAMQRLNKELVSTAFIDPTHRRFIPLEMIPYYFDARFRISNHADIRCDWHLVRYGQRDIGETKIQMGSLEYLKLVLYENEVELVKP